MGCIDDARKHPGLILIAATNFYDGLDRALIREGRFDLHIRIDLPNEDERTRIFDAQLARRPARKFGLQPFAKKTPGWSAAKIARSSIAPPSLLPNSTGVSKSAT